MWGRKGKLRLGSSDLAAMLAYPRSGKLDSTLHILCNTFLVSLYTTRHRTSIMPESYLRSCRASIGHWNFSIMQIFLSKVHWGYWRDFYGITGHLVRYQLETLSSWWVRTCILERPLEDGFSTKNLGPISLLKILRQTVACQMLMTLCQIGFFSYVTPPLTA